MSNYTKLTDFASKDALPTGSPAKIVKGTEIDDEFQAIENVIATKANLESPALTGTPTVPTAAEGTNTTQIATTEFCTRAVDALEFYPVGSIYMNAAVNTNPATLLGFGTWVEFGAGKVLVGLDSTDTDFDTLEETGGEKTHTLTEAEMPAHTHSSHGTRHGANGASAGSSFYGSNGDTSAPFSTPITKSTGGDEAHNNLQPYIVVHMWKRTA